MAASNLQITVAGRWQTLEALIGDVAFGTCWPGGSDVLSWTPGKLPRRRHSGGEVVVAYFGGVPVFNGNLTEPDPSQEQLSAVGAWRKADKVAALDGSGNATDVPDTAIDAAIARGALDWTRPVSLRSTSFAIDITGGPVMIGAMLDALSSAFSPAPWGVNPYRQVYRVAANAGPTWQTLPIDGGLGYALDDYACTLIGRYINNSGVPSTATVTDAPAEGLHGIAEATVDLTGRGQISGAGAASILTNLLALGRSTPQWTAAIALSYGEILSMGGVPVALETVAAGQLLRVHGGFELAQRQNGAMYIDVPIGRTSLADGLLTITPQQIAARNFTDLLTQLAQSTT